MKKSAIVALGLVASLAGPATAGGIVPYTEYHPQGRFVISASGSAHVLGGQSFAGFDSSDLAIDSTAITGSVGLTAGGFVYPNVELGGALRYAPSIRADSAATGNRQVDVGGRIAFHIQPWRTLDGSFAIHFGYSHISLPATATSTDPTGPVFDLIAGLAYPFGGGAWATCGLGLEHGLQRTQGRDNLGNPADAAYTTTFLHLDVGVAYRF